MYCLSDIGNGFYKVASPQPTEFSGCTYLIVQPNEIPIAFMNMTPAEGLKVGGLLALVLVAGFTFRALARAIDFNLNNGDSNE